MDRLELATLLAHESTVLHYSQGQTIVEEGALATEGLAFLLAGEAKVVQDIPGARALLGFIKVGQFFGETALVLDRPRLASVVASMDGTTVAFIKEQQFLALIEKSFGFLDQLSDCAIQRIEKVLSLLVRFAIDRPLIVDPQLVPIILENRKKCLRIPEMLNHSRSILIGSGKPVFSQGDRNDGQSYIVIEGSIKVGLKSSDQDLTLFEFGPGDFFGYSRIVDSPYRKYSALAQGENARLVGLDQELLAKVQRFDAGTHYSLFRTMITQLVLLDDALRMLSIRNNAVLE